MKTNLPATNKNRPTVINQRLARRSFSVGGPSKSILGLLCLLIAAFLPACQKELSLDAEPAAQSSVNLRFVPVAGNAPLDFQTSYTNPFSELFTVTAFKFYITGMHLVNTGAGDHLAGSREHFLVDAGDRASVVVPFKANAGSYNAIAFILGVDSLRNTSGAQTGALDPTKGMFWTWNSGYIMAKLEGNSPVSAQPNNMFEYHIGGFRNADNVIKKIVLPLPLSLTRDFKADSTTTITITANINSWFQGTNDIYISTNPVCMTPGDLAKKIAGNYANMFTVVNVEGK